MNIESQRSQSCITAAFSPDLAKEEFVRSDSEEAKPKSAPLPFRIKCDECGAVATVEECNSDAVRFFLEDGTCVRFGVNTTQAKLDSLLLICECCQSDREEEEDY